MSDRVFRVRWCSTSEPYIVVGDVYEVGKSKKQSRVRERNGPAGQQMRDWHPTIIAAMDAEIVKLSNTFGHLFRRGKAYPWAFARMVAKLTRLKTKLEHHGIIPA